MDKKNLYLHSFLKLNYKTFCASWCGLILLLLILFSISSSVIICRPIITVLPEAQNSHYEPKQWEIVTVYIDKRGMIFMNDDRIDDISRFPILIEDRIDEKRQRPYNKLLLKADKNVQYGKVVEVLKCMSKANIQVVGLVTKEYATVIDFIYE